jgi:2-polyprenyl-3-methyl-5-hydroxy-6-metoxy-1,4-benzoquinol methylase
MNAYFDTYSENYRNILAQSTGEDIESASFFASQKVSHLARCYHSNHSLQSILDYGCGVGMSLRPMRQTFPKAEIFGVDPSQSSLDIAAREHADCHVKMLPLEELNQSGYAQHFDLIFISCVFHHIDSKQHVATLNNLRNLCSPTGLVAIFEHNPANPITRRIVRNCPFDEGVTLISPRTLRDRMTVAGWKGLRRSYISFVPPKLRRFKSLESVLGWCPLGAQYLITAKPN